MNLWIEMITGIVCAVLASTGLWSYLQKRSDRKDVKTRMLIGLAHDRIISLVQKNKQKIDTNI